MKRPVNRLFAACLATMVAGGGSEVIVAAEGALATQDLVNVRAAGQVTASWTRQTDFYALQVVMESSKPSPPRASTPANLNAEEMRQQGVVNVADALQQLVPQNISTYMPTRVGDGQSGRGGAGIEGLDRSSFFVGNTIANLRGLDPSFGCRTLTLVDGRRVVAGQSPPVPAAPPAPSAPTAPVVQSYPPKIKYRRIDVWLLRADGTQILPAAYICAPPSASQSKADEITYRYSVADSTQAVAAAIRIDNEFYIEKLQPLESRPSGQ
jgi:hypothetical protein